MLKRINYEGIADMGTGSAGRLPPMKRIKAPGVDKLEDLKNIISTLEYGQKIPYSFISTEHLDELKKNKKLKPQVYKQIQQWKTENNFSQAKGYVQPLISLSSALNIVETTKFEKSELDRTLGTNGPILSTFIDKKIQAVQLTSMGYTLCDLVKKKDQNSKRMYDEILFWLFLHGRVRHHINRLIESPGAFSVKDPITGEDEGIEVRLRKIETDPTSIRFFLKWIDYFDLKGLNQENPNIAIFSKIKIAKKILVSTVLDLNTLKPKQYFLKDLEEKISASLDLSPTFVNFFNIFQMILNKLKTNNETNDIITGSTGSRGEVGLPDRPSLNIFVIRKKIPPELFLEKFSDVDLKSILNIDE